MSSFSCTLSFPQRALAYCALESDEGQERVACSDGNDFSLDRRLDACIRYAYMLIQNKLGALGLLLSDALERASADISPSAAALLLTLFYIPNTTATEAAKIAGISQPTAVRVLDGLVRQGFVKRDGRVGRTTVLRVTPSGRQRARLLQAARLKAMNDLLRPLVSHQRTVFERAVDTLLGAATTSRAFARTTCRLCDHRICTGRLCPIGTHATEIEQEAEAKQGAGT